MLYFWLEFSTNTLENVQNVSLNSHDILVFCIHRASKNSIKCADVLQYFNPSTFINCTWSQKQRKMTIKTSKSRMMFPIIGLLLTMFIAMQHFAQYCAYYMYSLRNILITIFIAMLFFRPRLIIVCECGESYKMSSCMNSQTNKKLGYNMWVVMCCKTCARNIVKLTLLKAKSHGDP